MLTANWDRNSDKLGDVRFLYIDDGRTYVHETCIESGRPGKWERKVIGIKIEPEVLPNDHKNGRWGFWRFSA